jgi:ribosome maturation factor RimP
MPNVYEQERELTGEVADAIGRRLPDVEVLAVELVSPRRFCVYVDRPGGVDHALCARVTDVLRGYLDRYSVDVSSPGIERPLRTAEHFRGAVGHKVALRTGSAIDGRTRFRGKVLEAGDDEVTVEIDGGEAHVPYEEIVRGNLTDEDAWT